MYLSLKLEQEFSSNGQLANSTPHNISLDHLGMALVFRSGLTSLRPFSALSFKLMMCFGFEHVFVLTPQGWNLTDSPLSDT